MQSEVGPGRNMWATDIWLIIHCIDEHIKPIHTNSKWIRCYRIHTHLNHLFSSFIVIEIFFWVADTETEIASTNEKTPDSYRSPSVFLKLKKFQICASPSGTLWKKELTPWSQLYLVGWLLTLLSLIIARLLQNYCSHTIEIWKKY